MCISKLIDAGARVNEADRQGRTPLHEAAERGRSDVVAILQTHGANVEDMEMVTHTHTHQSAFRNNHYSISLFFISFNGGVIL